MYKVIMGLCVAVTLSGCCGMYTNGSKPAAGCGCPSSCGCDGGKKITY